MKRRQFLKTGLHAALWSQTVGITRCAFAQGSSASLPMPLIVVFLRGGADGLGMLAPLEDPNFIAARPPEMRFAIPPLDVKNPVSIPLTLGDTNLYWHPGATQLAQLYQARRLLAWPAVGFDDETRSHFEAQEIMERGLQSLQKRPDDLGWFTRQYQANLPRLSAGALLPLFAGSNAMPRAFQGSDLVLAARDLQAGIPFPGGANLLKVQQALCEAESANNITGKAMLRTLDQIEAVNQALPKVDGKTTPYMSAGSLAYPNSDPGIGLRSAARLLQARVGLQYAWVDQGGWDTHESQGYKLQNLLTQLGQALLAFDEDMKMQNQAYSLVVLTEFGRRLRTNRSNGTDHGHGSLALVQGSHIPGGQVMGRWPGLETAQLNRGVDLAVTTNYQALWASVLGWSATL